MAFDAAYVYMTLSFLLSVLADIFRHFADTRHAIYFAIFYILLMPDIADYAVCIFSPRCWFSIFITLSRADDAAITP